MKRERIIDGPNVRMADGSDWVIPRLSSFPCRYGINASGDVTKEVDSKYSSFVERATKLNRLVRVVSGEDIQDEDIQAEDIPLDETLDIVCEAISINYHIDRDEILRRKMLDERSLTMCMIAMIIGGVNSTVDDSERVMVKVR